MEDKVQVKACGVGLEIGSFDDIKLNKISLKLLERIGVSERVAG